jgi:hypothetical protein
VEALDDEALFGNDDEEEDSAFVMSELSVSIPILALVLKPLFFATGADLRTPLVKTSLVSANLGLLPNSVYRVLVYRRNFSRARTRIVTMSMWMRASFY